ncbi:hypothetical protein DSO57_1034054 [Entomophthora muscae]|uniref:Uncharacterized protein n=1 Tax=Entomophthora muscae TaxID=34485 RepID=A0ACC2TLL9_9FUNG|nr:hypothetical protein DSO57_1034054 [Entomophthora muscae]
MMTQPAPASDNLPNAWLPDNHPHVIVKPQKMREYFSKVGYQVGNLEPCERRHNGVDRHHPSKDLGVYVKSSEFTGKVRKHIEYKGVYCYVLGGAGQHQRGPGVRLGGV